ncbi:MAG: VOC family protein [Bdellovibrionota bacterium]
MEVVNPRKLCQIEIMVSDLDRSLLFYDKVFGWKAVPAYIYNYVVLDVPESCPFGVSLIPDNEVSKSFGTRVILYFEVNNSRSVVELAYQYGGKKILEKKLPGYGRTVQLSDPDGQIFGLYIPQ